MSTPQDRFRTAADCYSATLRDLSTAAWDQPSRCDEWTIRDVVSHVVSTERDFLEQRSLPVPDIGDLGPDAAWPLVRSAMAAVLADQALVDSGYDGYFGPTTIGETIDRFYTLDLILHRWDIASAVGLSQHESLDEPEMAAIEAALGAVPEEVLRSPGLFGPAIEVPEQAPRQLRLLGFTGRRG